MGDTEASAFEAFVAARGPSLLRYAFMLTHDAGRAEDVVQDALVRAHRGWSRISAVEQPEAYVRRIVTNEFLSWRRRRSSNELAEAVPATRVADPAVAIDERDEMWRALAGLPQRQRVVLVLRYYEDLTDTEIAAVLDCAVGTVSSLAHRALAALRTAAFAGPDPADKER